MEGFLYSYPFQGYVTFRHLNSSSSDKLSKENTLDPAWVLKMKTNLRKTKELWALWHSALHALHRLQQAIACKQGVGVTHIGALNKISSVVQRTCKHKSADDQHWLEVSKTLFLQNAELHSESFAMERKRQICELNAKWTAFIMPTCSFSLGRAQAHLEFWSLLWVCVKPYHGLCEEIFYHSV